MSGTPCYDPRIATFLDAVYASCGGAERLMRDPLALVAPFTDPRDREIAGLFASTLAFGAVDLILRAVRCALFPLGAHPAAALAAMNEGALKDAWGDFQYRYCFSKDIIALARGARRALLDAGSLEDFFLRGDPGGGDVVAAAASFSSRLLALGLPPEGGRGMRMGLLPDPGRGSACKRLFLYLRWMVRRDAVDPGGWERIGPERLIVPLDTHMARISATRLRFIPSPRADLKNALAVTAAFRLYAPFDPVKYDFALTRLGIDPLPGDERFSCP